MKISVFVLLFLHLSFLSSCRDDDSGSDSSSYPVQDESEVAEEHVIRGKLSLEGKENLTQQQVVNLTDSDGLVVASTFSDSEGAYEISVPNTLVLTSESNLLADNIYNITSLIRDNGEGKVLAVKKPVNLVTGTFEKGILVLGSESFIEIAAIKGKIKFTNPDGSENLSINKVGTDIYLPGFSFFAKSDNEGNFLILYVPPETYSVRIENGLIDKEISAEVVANTTLNLGEISITTDTQKPMTSSSLSSIDFRDPTCVSLSVNETANTYYTLDGSNPQASESFLYSGTDVSCGSNTCPICIQNKTTTLKYFSVDSAGNQENLGVQVFFYNEKWADPQDSTTPATNLSLDGTTLSEDSVTLAAATTVVLSVNEGANIYYTTDGSTPTTSSAIFEFGLKLTSTTTFKYFAVDWAGNTESVQTKTINILNWKKITYSGSPPAKSYKQNSGNSMAYDPSQDQIIYFCNTCGAGSVDETWKFKSGAWTKVANLNTASDLTTMTYNSSDNKIYLLIHPDRTTSSAFVVYTYNSSSDSWDSVSGISGISTPPSTLWETSAAYDIGTQRIIYKFSTLSHGILSYSYNTATGVFTSLTTTSAEFARLAYDANRSKMVGFGQIGDAYNNYTGSVFELSDTSWSAKTTNTVPFSDVFVYDSVRQLIVAFGAGTTERESVSNLLWTYDGTDWTPADPSTLPKPRNSPFLVYDSAGDRIIMYGGTDKYSQNLSDMWEYSK